MSDPKVDAARRDAADARREVIETLHVLQNRLNPATIASDTLTTAKRRGEALASDAVEAVRRQPTTVAAAAGGVGALLGLSLFLRGRRRKAKRLKKTGDKR